MPLEVAITGGTQGAGVLVNNADYIDGVEISGTGTAGASGVVTAGGVSHHVTVDGNGNWSTTYTPAELAGGEYQTGVSVTLTDGTKTATATDTLVLDTIASVSVSVDTVETDGIVSFVEEADGVTITGTTEAGSTVVVRIDGVNYNAVVTGENWSLNLPAGTIDQGEYDLNVRVTATDAHGNTATVSDVVHIDTVTSLTLDTSAAGGDGTVNRVEHANGVTVGGVAEANASVVVTMAGHSHTVSADEDGNWTATFSSAETPTGTRDVTVTAVSTDAGGNTATASGVVHIDTDLSTAIDTSHVETDGIVNIAEHADGVTLNGTADAGAQVTVTFGTGTRVVTAGPNGTWSANWSTAEVPTGQVTAPVSVRATDNAGNVATATATVRIDTVIDVAINPGGITTGGGSFNNDGVVNMTEHANGVRLTGTSEGADTVRVNLGGVARDATVAADGTWYVNYAHSQFASGETTIPVTVTARDAAGNVDTATSTLEVDTFVNRLANAAVQVEGDDIVNNAEAADGITLNGVVEEGSTVMVTFEGTTRAATVDVDGNWSVHFDASEIPAGEYPTTVEIRATDGAGNVASITDTFMVDTIAPDAADIESVTYSDTTTRGFSMLNVETGIAVDVTEFVNGSDAGAMATEGGSYVNPLNGELTHLFTCADEIPAGSHLVVTSSDAAGNSNSTLLVLDNDTTDVVDMGSAAIGNFNIGAIDLEFADDSQLTLSVADLEGLSANDNKLIVHGGTDDHVTLNGTATVTGTTSINGQDYDVYAVGANGGELIISQDIDFNQSVI